MQLPGEMQQVAIMFPVFLPLPKCPTCTRATSMRRRKEHMAVVDCSYFKLTASIATIWCAGYERADDHVIRRRSRLLNAKGYYDEGGKGGVTLEQPRGEDQ